MARNAAPRPYDVEIAGAGYLFPPARIMRVLDASVNVRDSLPWFPVRSQQAAISESLFPPRAETASTVADRSHGFGWTDNRHPDGGDADALVNYYAYTDAVDAGAGGDGQGVDCSVESVAFLGPKINTVAVTGGSATMSGHFELSPGGTRTLFVVHGTKLFRSTNGTTFAATQAAAADLPAVLTGRPRVFRGSQGQDQVYFPMGAGQTFRTWDGVAANAFGSPTTTDTNKVIDFYATADKMWALWLDTATNRYRVSNFQDGIAGASSGTTPVWNPSIAVTDRSDPAQYLLAADGVIYVGCNRSLHALDATAENYEKQIWATTAPGTDNFRWWNQWRDELWFTADQGEYRLKPANGVTVFEPVGPSTLPNNRTPVRGVVRAKCSDDYCHYRFLRTEAGVTYLLKRRTYDDGRREADHVISRIGTVDVNYAFVSTVQGTNPILYFGTGSAELRYFVLPRNGLYPPSDENCEFTDKGYVFDTRMHGGMHFVAKALLACTGRVDAATSTEAVTAYYRTGSGDAFSQFGSSSVTTEPGTRLQLADPEICAWWEGRIKLVRGSTVTATPKLLATTYAYALRPLAKGQFTVYIWLSDHLPLRNGGKDKRSALAMETTLINLDSGTSPVGYTNKRGVAYRVFVDEVRVIDFYDEADQPTQGVCKITMTEFAARAIGTHSILGNYTHDQLAVYTHDQLAQLVG
jgi:hypothetical protein